MVSATEQRFGTGAWPWVLLVTAAFVVSTNHVLGRYVGGQIPPMGLAFWRVSSVELAQLEVQRLAELRPIVLKPLSRPG